MQKNTDVKAVFLYGLTIFLSAFLLFQVQPMMGKMILPWFGGSASVWTTCMLFFQALLLLGYLYTHWLVNHLTPARQSPSSQGLAGQLRAAASHRPKRILETHWR